MLSSSSTYLTTSGDHDSSDDEDSMRGSDDNDDDDDDDDGNDNDNDDNVGEYPPSLSPPLPRKLLVRDGHFEEGLAELEAAVTVPQTPGEAARQPAEIAKLTFQGGERQRRFGIYVLRDLRISFGRFVDLLEQSMLPGRVAIRTLKIVEGIRGPLREDGLYRTEDLVRLFRDVMPNHPTIDRIQLGRCNLPARYVSLLVSSLPTTRATPLLELTLYAQDDTAATERCVDDICDMLRRNVPLQALSLACHLDPPYCHRIMRSLESNTHLQGLALHSYEVFDGTIWLASAPALRALHIRGEFQRCGVESLARQLKFNTTLVELYVASFSRNRELIVEMERVLKTYNYTLRSFRATYANLHAERDGAVLHHRFRHTSIPRSLQRNERIHHLLEQFPAYREAPAARPPQTRGHLPAVHREAPVVLLPRVLGMVSDVPTLLYRILKRSETNDLFEHIVQAEANQTKRGDRLNKKIRTS